MTGKTPLHFIHLSKWSILNQLQLEEALLRTDTRNFCLVNMGSSEAIVMGISNRAEELINAKKIQERPIPIYKRFSGGGTVFIDANTLFITFIFEKKAHSFPLFPEPIHRFVFSLYKGWNLEGFSWRENDYLLGDKKCGGNAQSIAQNRWLHHTSFLFDYNLEHMDYLKLPLKRPSYRMDRSHKDFLTPLSSVASSPFLLIESLKKELSKHFHLVDFDPRNLEEKPHRKSTEIIHFA